MKSVELSRSLLLTPATPPFLPPHPSTYVHHHLAFSKCAPDAINAFFLFLITFAFSSESQHEHSPPSLVPCTTHQLNFNPTYATLVTSPPPGLPSKHICCHPPLPPSAHLSLTTTTAQPGAPHHPSQHARLAAPPQPISTHEPMRIPNVQSQSRLTKRLTRRRLGCFSRK